MRPAAGKVPIVCDPVFTRVADGRGISFLNFHERKAKSHLSDLAEQQVTEILYACRTVHHLESKSLPGTCHVLLQCFIERIVDVDQHPVIVELLEPWFDPGVEVAEESADVSVTLHLEMAPQTIPMTVKISAFILQCFVSVCGVKLVLLLDDHSEILNSYEQEIDCLKGCRRAVFGGMLSSLSSAC